MNNGPDASEISALEWGFGILVTICLTVGGWLWARLLGTVIALRGDIQEMDRNHSSYQLDAEKRFAKDADVSVQFGKLHDGMDSMRKDISGICVSMASLAASAAAGTKSQK